MNPFVGRSRDHRPATARHSAFAAALVAGSLLMLAPALAAGPGAAVVTAVYPPWWSAPRAAASAAASAQIEGPGRLPFLMVVRVSGPTQLTGLREHGAWLLLNLGAGACDTPKELRG